MPALDQRKVSEEEVIRVIKEKRGKLYIAAQVLGITPQTMSNYIRKNETIRRAVKNAKGLMKDVAEDKLFNAIDSGSPWAICFYLKTQAKDRGYIETAKVHVGQDKDAPPIQTVNANVSFDLTQLGLPKETLELIYARMEQVKNANPAAIPDEIEEIDEELEE